MDKLLVLFATLAIVVGFCWRAGRLAKRAVQGRPDADELESALVAPVRFLALLLLPSMTLAASVASWDAELGASTGEPASAGAAAARAILGSALLMELVARSAGDRSALEEPTPELAGLRAMRNVFGTTAFHLFLAAVGIAALFGGAADRQVASVLAIDCALMGVLFAFAYRARRGRWERATRGVSDDLDPAPDGAPNMTELTRCFPAGALCTIRSHVGSRIELGQRRTRPSTIPRVQAVVAVLAIGVALVLVAARKPVATLLPIGAGVGLVAMGEREKRRPAYRVAFDTGLAIVSVTPGVPDARTETLPMRQARLAVERKDEEGYSTQGRLVLALAGDERKPLPLLDWVRYGEAREAARALAGYTGLPLDMEESPSWVIVS